MTRRQLEILDEIQATVFPALITIAIVASVFGLFG